MGVKGLANVGNTCFANAALQLLWAVPEVVAALARVPTTQWRWSTHDAECRLLSAFRALSEHDGAYAMPTEWIAAFRRVAAARHLPHLAADGQQNDVAEAWTVLVRAMHDAVAKPLDIRMRGTPSCARDHLAVLCLGAVQRDLRGDFSAAWRLLQGVYVSRLRAPGARAPSTQAECFTTLALDVCPTLADGFEAFVRPETLADGSVKQLSFWSFPAVLVVQFKRFSPDGRAKHRGHVQFPVRGLDLCAYAHDYRPSQYVYDLVGVAHHHGSTVDSGHYTADTLDADTGAWMRCNDLSVRRVPSEDELVAPTAYVLVYRRRDCTHSSRKA